MLLHRTTHPRTTLAPTLIQAPAGVETLQFTIDRTVTHRVLPYVLSRGRYVAFCKTFVVKGKPEKKVGIEKNGVSGCILFTRCIITGVSSFVNPVVKG